MSTAPGESAPPAAGPSREYRATAAFLIGGLFAFGALVLSRDILQSTPPIGGVVVGAGVVVGMLSVFAAAFGLTAGRAWAVAVMTPMLMVLMTSDAARLLWALGHGSLDIPLGLVLAVWALRAPIRTKRPLGRRGPRPGAAGVVVLVGLLVSATGPLLGTALLRPGGPLIVGDDALKPNLEVICGDSPGSQPAFLQIAYDWQWLRAEPLAAGIDTITLSWHAFRDDGATGYQLDPMGSLGAGISETNVLIGRTTGLVFGVDLAVRGFEPGALTLSLSPSGAPPLEHGVIEVSASYLHAPTDTYQPDSPATWRIHTSARCEW